MCVSRLVFRSGNRFLSFSARILLYSHLIPAQSHSLFLPHTTAATLCLSVYVSSRVMYLPHTTPFLVTIDPATDCSLRARGTCIPAPKKRDPRLQSKTVFSRCFSVFYMYIYIYIFLYIYLHVTGGVRICVRLMYSDILCLFFFSPYILNELYKFFSSAKWIHTHTYTSI